LEIGHFCIFFRKEINCTAAKITCDSPLIARHLDKHYGKLLNEFGAKCKVTKNGKFESCICLCFHSGIFVFLEHYSSFGLAKQGLEYLTFVNVSNNSEVCIEKDSAQVITFKVTEKNPNDETHAVGPAKLYIYLYI